MCLFPHADDVSTTPRCGPCRGHPATAEGDSQQEPALQGHNQEDQPRAVQHPHGKRAGASVAAGVLADLNFDQTTSASMQATTSSTSRGSTGSSRSTAPARASTGARLDSPRRTTPTRTSSWTKRRQRRKQRNWRSSVPPRPLTRKARPRNTAAEAAQAAQVWLAVVHEAARRG